MSEHAKEVPASHDLEKIRSGVRFLSHPDVQATPLSERLAFLEKKGLSRAEINAAIEQHHQATPLAAPGPPQSMLSFAWSFLFPVISTATLMGVLWRFLRNDDVSSDGSDAVVPQPAKSPLELALEAQTDELRKVVQLLQDETKSRRVQSVEQIEHAREIAKLQAEIAALKVKLSHLDDTKEVSQGGASNAAQTTATSTDITSRDAHDSATEFHEQVQKLLDALDLVARDNSTDVIKQAGAVLLMYTKNLVEHPEVPRYRRIATGNANFKQKIERLVHYDVLLTSIGFEKAGMNFEWKWHAAPALDKFVDILKAASHAFENAMSPTPSSDSLAECARRQLLNSVQPSGPQPPSPVVQDSTTDSPPSNLATFLNKLKGQDECTSARTAQPEPTYPASFTEVVNLIKKGDP
ncbi:hypothetical protein H310_11485 [Aphanomyces invadans]|uniref:Peroxisomal membrane protein PEX14 n=1 Tax=Aphanomyces invadans TaxID=157072 RepID=A0A024TN97_9STRA|nr:hypothetical protein H310_11485 [Aphanomyces invadans]ETV94817.1 hypothetical protein H310_11485 [Aphanomyces invadans]|eukprot:XP_008876408.1 hypothetical protein H310_11485 [Aphanomyces invadans]